MVVILQMSASTGKTMHVNSLLHNGTPCVRLCNTEAPVIVCTTKHLKKLSILIKTMWN